MFYENTQKIGSQMDESQKWTLYHNGIWNLK